MRISKETIKQDRPQWKSYLYMIVILLLLVWASYTIELINSKDENIHIFEVANASDIQVSQEQVVVYEEKIVPYVITENLPEDYNHKKEMIHMYLRSLGESEEDIATWDRIIQQESKYNQNSQAPTYWSQCSDGRFIELTDHGNGVMWQDTCDRYGLETIESGYSGGLLHIIEPTKREHNCEISNWMSELQCGVSIKNVSGFQRWASY